MYLQYEHIILLTCLRGFNSLEYVFIKGALLRFVKENMIRERYS